MELYEWEKILEGVTNYFSFKLLKRCNSARLSPVRAVICFRGARPDGAVSGQFLPSPACALPDAPWSIRVEWDVTIPTLSYDTEGAAFGVPDVQVSPPPLINAGGSGASMPMGGALYETIIYALAMHRLRLVAVPM